MGDPHEIGDKPQRIRRMFASIADAYDLNNRLHSFGRDQAWRHRAVKLAEVTGQDHVLDVACGTGDLAIAFARAGACSVTGVDFTPQMLEIARAKASKALPGREPVFQSADAMDLPFSPESFDVVSIAFGIRNVADPYAALREFQRVLRPRGRLIVLEFSKPPNPIIRFGNAVYCNHIMPWTATLIARDRSGAYRYLPRSIETFLEGESMCEALREAGFRDAQQFPMTLGVCSAYRGWVGEGAEAQSDER